MKYSVQTHKYGNYSYETFDKVLYYFCRTFLKTTDIKKGREFLYDFGNYIEKSDFPSNRIVLCCFTGYSNRFGISLYYNEERIAYIQIEVKKYNIFQLYSTSYDKKDFKMFNGIIEKYFDIKNQSIFNEWCTKCNITNNNTVEIENYVDFNLKDVTTLSGTLDEIFDTYTTINDTYKYCNGYYVRFKDSNIEALYYIFTTNFKGNYFLENAVKRGVIID